MTTWWASDPHAHPVVVAGANGAANTFQPVVPVIPATELHAERAKRNIKFIVQHDQLIGTHAVEVHQRLHRASTVVHEGLRFCKHDWLRTTWYSDPRFTGQRHRPLVASQFVACASGQVIDRHEADVVTISGVGRPRVTEADHKPGHSAAAASATTAPSSSRFASA